MFKCFFSLCPKLAYRSNMVIACYVVQDCGDDCASDGESDEDNLESEEDSEIEDENDASNEEWTSSNEARTEDDEADLEATAVEAIKKLVPYNLEEFEKVLPIDMGISSCLILELS